MKLAKETEDSAEDTSTGTATRARKAKREKTSQANRVHPVLFDRLKQLRTDLAKEENVPAYVIFSNATLTDMCMKLPKNEEQFLDVSGVGEVKLERYGDLFIKEIRGFLSENRADDMEQITIKPVDTLQEFEEFLQYVTSIKTDLTVFDEPVLISVLVDTINSMVMQRYHIKLSPLKVTNWLLEQGYLDEVATESGNSRMPTAAGLGIGLAVEEKTRKNGTTYPAIYYAKPAQLFICEHIIELYQFGWKPTVV